MDEMSLVSAPLYGFTVTVPRKGRLFGASQI